MKNFILKIMFVFLILPIAIDQLIMNKFPTNWKLDDWASFLGSYLGSGIGAMISFYALYWQTNRIEKKEKKKEK